MVERASPASLTRQSPIGPIGAFLERFRRTGGVPAAVGGELTSELAPVFAALDGLEHEVAVLRAAAEEAAARHAHEADEEAERIMAEARERAESELDDVREAGLRTAALEVAAIVEDAEREAKAILAAGEERMPVLIAEVLELVMAAEP
jgi:vacuolar-type H+-ATPase subunit H